MIVATEATWSALRTVYSLRGGVSLQVGSGLIINFSMLTFGSNGVK